MKPALLLLAVVFSGLAQVTAQTAAPVTPLPLSGIPIQRRAPDFATWSVMTVTTPAKTSASTSEASPEGDATEAPAHTSKAKHGSAKNKKNDSVEEAANGSPTDTPANPSPVITFTKTPSVAHVEYITASKQQPTEVWITGGRQYVVSADGSTASELEPPSSPDLVNPLYTDFSKTDFPELAWVNAKNFVGVEESAGHPCLIFRETAKLEEKVIPEVVRSAAVDYYSRLPVALEVGGVKQEYAFKLPPQATLLVPENVQRAIQALGTDKKKAERGPSNPY